MKLLFIHSNEMRYELTSETSYAEPINGQQRRAEWVSEDKPKASPLSYRWGIVKRMLSDLRDSL